MVIGVFLKWFKSKTLCGIDSGTFTGSIAVLAMTGAVFLVLFFLGGYLFKIKEISEIKNSFVKKFKDLYGR